METFYDPKPGLLKKSAIALGFFDGVHPGHQAVIGTAVREAARIGATAGVVTFKDHPRGLTRGSSPLLLTTIEQKLELFAGLGVEAVLVLSFTEDLCKLSPREYVENVLTGAMGARSISVGYNHHFGRDREGDPALLKKLGAELDFTVHVASMVYVDGEEVSSSRVRDLVGSCQVETAARLLSRPYTIIGDVIHGEGRGRKIGFPTANIDMSEFQLVPGRGVYAGTARLSGEDRHLPCVINVGLRPTFNKSAPERRARDGQKNSHQAEAVSCAGSAPLAHGLLVEVHILDFDEDLYGRGMQVEFRNHLRHEQKFSGVEALKTQIDSDCQVARELLRQADLIDKQPV